MAAVLILGDAASAGRADAWRALVSALRDPTPMVWATADQVLAGVLKQDRLPTIGWGPSIGELRTFLDGTNLYVYERVLEVLTATRVSPALATPLLRGGGQLLLAKLSSSYPQAQHHVRAFLVQIAGRDLGSDPLAWQAWIGEL